MMTLSPGTRLGDYTLAELLGAGGMGKVFRATHDRIGREVALKVLSPDCVDGEMMARFDNEARIHSGLAHANIATFYDILSIDGVNAFVMEFVPGETLADRIKRRGRLEPGEALHIFRQVVSAVAYCHERGVIHRDLKSNNVRIRPDGVAKVLDFGIAKGLHTPGLTAKGGVVGTPEYLSPEQLKSGRATTASDVWALGVLLFEMLAGRVPFAGTFPNQIWTAIQRAGTPSLETAIGPSSPAVTRVDAVLGRCLAVGPSARYRGAVDLLAALDAATAEIDPVRARPVDADTARKSARISRLPDLKSQLTRLADCLARRWAWLAVAAAMVLLAALVVSAIDVAPAPDPSVSPDVRTRHLIAVAEGQADVFVNGQFVGRTPVEYAARPHEVVALELRQRGFASHAARFDVTERRVWTFSMKRGH